MLNTGFISFFIWKCRYFRLKYLFISVFKFSRMFGQLLVFIWSNHNMYWWLPSGLLVPGGFGVRGSEGKIRACHWARTKKVPFLGVCLGLQCAVIEFARNVLKWEDANSTEMNPDTKHPVVSPLDQHSVPSYEWNNLSHSLYFVFILRAREHAVRYCL